MADEITVAQRLECYNTGMKLVEITDRTQWDSYVGSHPWGHPLQLWGWGETKRENAWVPYRLALVDGERWVGAVQVVLWRLPRLNYWIVYAPRGPVAEPGGSVAKLTCELLVEWASRNNGLYVRIDPSWREGAPRGWVKAKHSLQMAETYVIDLRADEPALLEPMSRKHRQYIRKAERDGITVVRSAAPATSDEIDVMFSIYNDTSTRAGFGIHSRKYYEQLAREFGENSHLYFALYEERPVAFLWLVTAGVTAYELYGGVTETGQDFKANYFLKWEAMRTMKRLGLERYDFNGRVTEGVAKFKEGFGPEEVDYIGAYDYPLNRLGYRLWEGLWPVAKRVGRAVRGRKA